MPGMAWETEQHPGSRGEPPPVHVVGSINVDLVVRAATLPAPGETVAGGTFARHGGGKSANQAVAAARAGARVRMVGAVGDDDLGEEALGLLAAERIDVAGVARLAGVPTGVALIVVDAAGENQIAVASGANAELAAEHVTRRLAGLDDGVVLLGLEVPDDAVLAAARAGLPVVLNPAPARRLPDELLDLSPILTPNAAEACELAGRDDPAVAARTLAERTSAPVLVTLGARGVLLAEGDELETIPAIDVEPVDTTGAGDVFSGALACELAAGAPLTDAVRFAVAAAGLSTRRHGARDGAPVRASIVRELR
jgi:ribokinase